VIPLAKRPKPSIRSAGTAQVSKVIHVGGHPSGIAAGDGKVWVTVS
jgi:hypothetical protein